MATNYASTLVNKYQMHNDTSMQGEVELAFIVVDILEQSSELTDEWINLLKAARGLIKTRAKRSRTKFRMQFRKAIDSADLAPLVDTPGQDLPTDREEKFKLRLLNPQFLRRRSLTTISKPVIDADAEKTIIKEDRPCTKEREDEFNRRLTCPRSFRRSN